VATLNDTASKFFSKSCAHNSTDKVVSQWGPFIKEAFMKYSKRNSPHGGKAIFPNSVIIYRDGLGEGQMKAVLDAEVNQIRAELERGKVTNVEIIFVVVQKRIDARFAIPAGTRLNNVPSGTVVDSGVVEGRAQHEKFGTTFDFYLVGQSHKQGNRDAPGTMNPVHYYVRYGTEVANPTTADEIEVITYKLCHMYYNWTGTVSVPAVCKYAKVLASMTCKSLDGKAMNPNLDDKLVYL